MKRIIISIVALASLALACQIQSPLVTQLPTLSPATTQLPTLSPKPTEQTCLIVTASKALHLRKDATKSSQALDWLDAGTILTALARDGDWWLVDTGREQGYVNSKFVEFCP